MLSPGINLIWLAPTLLAAWCIGSVRGFGSTSILAAALVVATPMMVGSDGRNRRQRSSWRFLCRGGSRSVDAHRRHAHDRHAGVPRRQHHRRRRGRAGAVGEAHPAGSGGGHSRSPRSRGPPAAGAGARPGGGSGGWFLPVVTGIPATSSRSGTRSRSSASAYCRRRARRRCSMPTTTPWPTTAPIPGSSATG